MEIEKFHFQKY
jgi:hypothetical protein